jgi:ankyrin repeat protein
VIQLLLARGADVNARNKAGVAPAEAAEKNGFKDAVQLLRKR